MNKELQHPASTSVYSMADEDTGYGSKAESDSIGNQRMLINRFLDNHPELSHCQRSEFADDGYTGTNFHRPQFTQMMEKVKRGEIDLICVKDFSRFSRTTSKRETIVGMHLSVHGRPIHFYQRRL